MQKRVRVYIQGDVIGVGFRAWVKIQARVIGGITGWIRNTFNKPEVFGVSGGVEAVLVGEEAKVDRLIAMLKQGSPISHVEEVHIMHIEPKEEYQSFEIRPTKHLEH